MKIRFFCVLLALVMLLASCTGAEKSEISSEESITEAVTEDAGEEEKMLTVVSSGECNFKIIRSEDAGKGIVNMCASFRTEFKKRIECESVEIGTDFVYVKAPLDPEAPELLIGETNRDESALAAAELEKAGGNRFVIYASDYKIAIRGTSTYLTYQGLDWFMENCIKTGSDGKPEVIIKAGSVTLSDEYDTSFVDFEEATAKGNSLAFYSVETCVHIPTQGSFGTMQGGGSDGTYAYYAMIDSSTLKAIIYKYEIATWKLVATSEEIPTGHSNDIAYDAVNKRLVLSYCHTNDGYTGVCFIDAETLAFQSYTQTSFAQRAVEYLPATNQYLFGTNYFYTLTDADLKAISTFNDSCPYYTTQGMCCDDKYVYDVRWESKETVQHIIVHRYSDGKCIGEIPFYWSDGEPENIFRYGDEFYIGCNSTDSVYRVQLLPSSWWN